MNKETLLKKIKSTELTKSQLRCINRCFKLKKENEKDRDNYDKNKEEILDKQKQNRDEKKAEVDKLENQVEVLKSEVLDELKTTDQLLKTTDLTKTDKKEVVKSVEMIATNLEALLNDCERELAECKRRFMRPEAKSMRPTQQKGKMDYIDIGLEEEQEPENIKYLKETLNKSQETLDKLYKTNNGLIDLLFNDRIFRVIIGKKAIQKRLSSIAGDIKEVIVDEVKLYQDKPTEEEKKEAFLIIRDRLKSEFKEEIKKDSKLESLFSQKPTMEFIDDFIAVLKYMSYFCEKKWLLLRYGLTAEGIKERFNNAFTKIKGAKEINQKRQELVTDFITKTIPELKNRYIKNKKQEEILATLQDAEDVKLNPKSKVKDLYLNVEINNSNCSKIINLTVDRDTLLFLNKNLYLDGKIYASKEDALKPKGKLRSPF